MMRLKLFEFWLFIFIILFNSTAVFGQSGEPPIRIAVGEDTLIYQFSDPKSYLYVDPYVSTHPTCCCNCSLLYSTLLNTDERDYDDYNHRMRPPFGANITLSPRHLSSVPTKDTILGKWDAQGLADSKKECYAYNNSDLTWTTTVTWSSFWDTIVKIRPLKNEISFYPDQKSHTYTGPFTSFYYDFYNNTNDTVTFSDWNISTTPTLPVTFTVRRSDTTINSIISPALERQIPLSFIFQTTEPTTRYERQYDGIIKTRVKTSSYDSIMTNYVTIILRADPTSDVNLATTSSTNKLQIMPNPSHGYVRALVTLKESTDGDLSVFDILGHKVRTISNSILSGDHEYNITLPVGSYYFRLQSSGGVATKRGEVE
jgi:hypothetical protein